MEFFKRQYSFSYQKIGSFDESVAVQAAAILTENGINVQAPEILQALQNASSKTRNGFRQFNKDLKASEVNSQ